MKIVNLEKTVKDAVEKVVARWRVEGEAERILISTTALLCDFLHSKNGGSLYVELREQQKNVGFFFPPLVEAILAWEKEGRNEVITGIRELAVKVGNYEQTADGLSLKITPVGVDTRIEKKGDIGQTSHLMNPGEFF